MKRIILLYIILFICLSSCNNKKTTTESMPPSSENKDIIEIIPNIDYLTESITPISEKIEIIEITPDIDFLTENFDKFVIDGSTTMIPLHQSLREKFSSKDDDIKHSKTVEAFEKFMEGKTHILLSVDYSDELLKKAKDKGIMLAKKEITKEGFVFLINKNNKVKNLTAEQIKDIYSDKIKNWNEVGGDNIPIKAYQRNSDSGSQIRMIKFMGEQELKNNAFEYISFMGDVIKIINDFDSGKYSIAYNMYTFTEKQYPSKDVILLAVNGVYPTDETIFNETYPIVIFNYIFYDSNNKAVSEFIEKLYIYLIADEGQKMISDSGYININKQYDRNLNINSQDKIEENEVYLGWRNKEKNEFYGYDDKTKDILIFNNYADFKLHNTKFLNNKKARDYLSLVINSNYELDNHAIWVSDKSISFSFWYDAEQTVEDFLDIRFDNKYYGALLYYPIEDKYILIGDNNERFNDLYNKYNYYNLVMSEEQRNNVAVSDIEIKKEELYKLYFRSYKINKVTKEYDYNLLFNIIDNSYSPTHRTTDNLRLREIASADAKIITTMQKDTKVQVIETGTTATIDDITASWVKVISSTGFTGWCFSGYLEEIADNIEYTESELEQSAAQFLTQDNAIKSVMPLPLLLVIIGGVVTVSIGVVLVVHIKKK